MSTATQVVIFGEVLFDNFPNGQQVLGGAPFNVAWHLQALDDAPVFVSRVGKDLSGDRVIQAMTQWGMTTSALQIDPVRPTGQVDVHFSADEPHYDIVVNTAYDFIDAEHLPTLSSGSLLYHGTLALRNEVSRLALERMIQGGEMQIFLDVNLRAPWWDKERVFECLSRAHWAKMNEDELALLDEKERPLEEAMSHLQEHFGLQHLIVTRGARGGLVRTADGCFHSAPSGQISTTVDTVGAGDAYSAVYIHGLLSGWALETILECAQAFAAKVVAMRGATSKDKSLYRELLQE